MSNPAFEHLVKGRHVYFTNHSGNEEAAIVARVHLLDGEPTENGLVNLMVIDGNGVPRSVVSIPYDEHGDMSTWRWMFHGQEKVSTAGASPTMLAPPADVSRPQQDSAGNEIPQRPDPS